MKGHVIRYVDNSQYNKNTPKQFLSWVNLLIGCDEPQDVDRVSPEQLKHYFSDLAKYLNPQKFHWLDVAEDVTIFLQDLNTTTTHKINIKRFYKSLS